ncbi:MAG: GIY-YIG nuclease family protein [Ruminococcaceae bacterium]|nr:GIY-YIG nuclease family protein [Oscillospiraceae bacterium]
MNNYYVYILSNWNGNVLYIGVTNDLKRRLYEHKNKITEGFTQKYNVNKLVYFETTSDVNIAINREKQLKGWKREKKNRLIESVNPKWIDISETWE